MPTKLYVGNVSYRATEEDLVRKFSETGNCLSAKIVLDSFTGQPRGFAFVEMASRDEATAAIAALNGYEFEGKRLRVNEARPREQRPAGGGGYRNNNHQNRY